MFVKKLNIYDFMRELQGCFSGSLPFFLLSRLVLVYSSVAVQFSCIKPLEIVDTLKYRNV